MFDDADAWRDAWDEALASDRPVVLEVKTDPEVPPLPPHITLKQATQFHGTVARRSTRSEGIDGCRHRPAGLEHHSAGRQALRIAAQRWSRFARGCRRDLQR